MYRNYFLRVSIFASLALLSFSASSAEVISQDQALTYALEHSPVLHGTASGVRVRSEQIKSVEAAKQPVIDLDYGMVYSDNPLVSLGSNLNNRSITAEDFSPETVNDPGFSDNYFGNLRLKLPLYTGGKITADIDEANAIHASSLAQHNRTKSTVI
jgi:outer membrane protein TolC